MLREDAAKIIGKKLVSVRDVYKNGAQHTSFLFEGDDGGKVSLSITAERGSDLWDTVRQRGKKKGS